jgi:hypothetical protein
MRNSVELVDQAVGQSGRLWDVSEQLTGVMYPAIRAAA